MAVDQSVSSTTEQSRSASSSNWRSPYIALIIAIILIVGGGLIANIAQTDGGDVVVRDVSFAGTNGTMMSGLLYIPNSATTKTPGCGVVAIHGYINSRDTMDGFAIEMSRRGCVVLAVDQTGQGYSDPPAFANSYGGPDTLAYLDLLDIVKKNDIGLIGHSMGGWASVLAAAAHGDDYRSLVLVSSSTSTPDEEPIPGTATFPKNVMVDEAQDSEFSSLMWAEPTGSQFVNSPRMQALFGTSDTIQVGQTYGSIANGTARQLRLVNTTHPGITFTDAGVGNAVSWMQQTLTGVSPMAFSSQIWLWDEIGTFLALLGVVLCIFPVGFILLRTTFFVELKQVLPKPKPAAGISWWISAIILIVVGILTFYPFQEFGNNLLPASALFPQTITTGIMVWAFLGGVIGLVLLMLWHFVFNQGARLANYGVTSETNKLEWRKIGKSLLLALAVLVAPYIAVNFLNWAFLTDAHIWAFNIKVITPYHVPIILSYLIPFAFYYLILSVTLHGQLRSARYSLVSELVKNIIIMVIGFVVFLLVEYIPLLAGGTLTTPDQPLLSVVAFQFIPAYIIVASISTYFFYRTGRIYTGAFINAIFIVTIIVTSTATQYPVLLR